MKRQDCVFRSHASKIQYIIEELVENVKDDEIKNELLEYLNGLLAFEQCGDPEEFEEDTTENYKVVKAYLEAHQTTNEYFTQYLERENNNTTLSNIQIDGHNLLIEVEFDDEDGDVIYQNMYCPECECNFVEFSADYMLEEIEFEAFKWDKDKLYFIAEMAELDGELYEDDLEDITDNEELIDMLNEMNIDENYELEVSTSNYNNKLKIGTKNTYQHTITYKLINKRQITTEVEDGIYKNVVYFQVQEISDKDTLGEEKE